MLDTFLSIDFPPLITAIFCAISCALVGSFLVVRKEALLADAISHSVLPGIVLAFYISSDRQGIWIFFGALVAAVSSAILIRLLKLYGKMENGAATGVVFSIYFALGIVLLEQLSASSIDLDVDCVLHGQIETIFWALPSGIDFFTLESLKYLPKEVSQSFYIYLIVSIFIIMFYKELIMFSFDSSFSKVIGQRVLLLDIIFIAMVSLVVVSAFRVVGSILVIAMLVCPAACARMYVDEMRGQLILSSIIAVIITVLGYYLGAFLPIQLGFSHSVGVAGVIAFTSGLFLIASVLFAPKYGVIGKSRRREFQRREILMDDILGFLFRQLELNPNKYKHTEKEISEDLVSNYNFKSVLGELVRKNLVFQEGDNYSLTQSGIDAGGRIIRKHRLWESYLVHQAGFREDHVHQSAEELEHLTNESHEEYLARKVKDKTDPHGKPIP